jgi:hypothetical protein
MENRNMLTSLHSAQRFKIQTFDGNLIDSIFIDRRASRNSNGRKLVICCEGNSDFYETGILRVPLKKGYSIIGWNPPGFGASEGKPSPNHVICAADAVAKLALFKLGFRVSDIIVFGWSIGGFPASWLSQKYPDIHGLILDATFDDVSHVVAAQTKAEPFKSFATRTIKKHFNLKNDENLKTFKGPLLIIRRLKDMMMQTELTDPIGSNRANELLLKVLSQRFPYLLSTPEVCQAMREYLTGGFDHQNQIRIKYQVDDAACLHFLYSYLKWHSLNSYPVNLGSPQEFLSNLARIQLSLFLCSKIMVDFDATHSDSLPEHMFTHPWNLFEPVFSAETASPINSESTHSE